MEDQEFLRPVITPYELIAALGHEIQWPTGYSLDFDSVLAAEAHESEGWCSLLFTTLLLVQVRKLEPRDAEDEDDGRPTFSLVSGTYRDAKRYGQQGVPD